MHRLQHCNTEYPRELGDYCGRQRLHGTRRSAGVLAALGTVRDSDNHNNVVVDAVGGVR
jgi:hypothetical protein